MISRHLGSVPFFFLLIWTVNGLQVAPGSPCSQSCLDISTSDITDPNGSNTFTTDIVCRDSDYQSTEAGKKFETCLTCLKGSVWTGFGEHDQAWFLYNLRFAAGSCLFDYQNMTATTVNPSCSTQATCGPLKDALLEDGLSPKSAPFSYCTAGNNAYLGSSLDKCVACVAATDDQKYLANFLTALQAGCLQRPISSLSIGLSGNIFSKSPVQATFPGDKSSTEVHSVSTSKSGLSRAAIIGIAAGVGVVVLLGAIFIVCCLHKRGKTSNMTRLKSPLDSRFGHKSITSPNSGAYGNPYASPHVNVNENFSAKELEDLEMASPLPSAKSNTSSYARPRGDTKIRLDTSNATIMPIHQAYIPGVTSPVSPATSIATISTIHTTNFSNPKKSPKIPLETIESPQSPPDVTAPELPSTTEQTRRADNKNQSERSRVQLNRLHSQTRAFDNDESHSSRVYTSRDRSNSQPRDRSRSTSRTRDMGNVDNARPDANTDGWRRATLLMGVGNANASQEKPIHASTLYGSRFDFAIAEKEQQEKQNRGEPAVEFDKRKRPNTTPSSAGTTEEQWPGNY